MLVGQGNVDEFEREGSTRRSLDSGSAQGSLPYSSSGGMGALILQKLDGNNRIETEVDGMGTRDTGVERKMIDISKRMWRLDAEMLDIRRRQDTPLSLAALSLRPMVSRGPADSASTTTTAAFSRGSGSP